MAKLPNYVVDLNPFHLAGPPVYFLRQLWEFDPSLVLVPSRQGFYYRLAQRRPLLLKESIVNDVLKEEADTKMLASYGLVPVTAVLATVDWNNPAIFEELRRRAPWRMGGWQKYEKMVLAQDQKDRLDKNTLVDERNTYLAKDAWKMYQKKVGLRSHLYSPVTKSKQQTPQTHSLVFPYKQYLPDVRTGWGNPNT